MQVLVHRDRIRSSSFIREFCINSNENISRVNNLFQKYDRSPLQHFSVKQKKENKTKQIQQTNTHQPISNSFLDIFRVIVNGFLQQINRVLWVR